jgi:hypothetical protein
MKVQQKQWTAPTNWSGNAAQEILNAHLVIGFGQREVLENAKRFEEIREMYPQAHIVLTSTSGEILDTSVVDESIALTAIQFDKSHVKVAKVATVGKNSMQVGKELAQSFDKNELKHILVFSEGSTINGTDLVQGMQAELGNSVTITGGLAGDGVAFSKTVVGLDAPPQEFTVVGIGLYGNDFSVGFGSYGGWEPFGAERTVTKSEANVLYELDGKPALELYKTYLGDKAKELPASALLFPLCTIDEEGEMLVRTILTIDEAKQSMTFAGDIPQNCKVRLMKSNHNKLVEGASTAAQNSLDILKAAKDAPSLAILVSCVGRKLVLKQRVEEEVEAVKDLLGDNAHILGFYSYGELAPREGNTSCYLHNQTMTITLLTEN